MSNKQPRYASAAAWLCALALTLPLSAETVTPEPEVVPAVAPVLDEEVQDLKSEVLNLNRELFLLEEELLFPANTQVAVFLSMDVGEFFDLDSVQLKLNGKKVGNYLYTRREVTALHRGGVQQLYLGNVKTGEHELVATFTGLGPQGREYKRGAAINFSKDIGAKFVELQISDREIKQQPEFFVREWE